MGLLDSILGGAGGNLAGATDFVNRYEQGAPSEGFSGDEALRHHEAVARHLTPEQYQSAAEQAFARMSPQERLEFGRLLQQQSRKQDFNFPDLNGDGIDDRLQDPRALAQVTSRMQQQQPGILGQLLGGAGGGALGGMLGGGGGGGLGSVVGGMLGGGGRSAGGGMGSTASAGADLLNSPVAKAAMGGIAAIAMRQLMSRR